MVENTKRLGQEFMRTYFLFLFLGVVLTFKSVQAQEKLFDEKTKFTLDSLDKRMEVLESKIKKMEGNRDASLFRTKRELDMTLFLRHYEEYVFDEDLMSAQRLINSKIKASEKRSDKYAISFYKGYQTKLTRLRGQKRTHYQELFVKEKNFKKEFDSYSKKGDEYNLTKTARMVELAIKYAEEQNLKETLNYLYRYRKLAEAMLFDLHSPYDLKKLSNSSKKFFKTFEPLIEDDSLHVIQEGMELAENCLNYTQIINCRLRPGFFDRQKIAAANAITDWNSRQGITAELASLTGQAIVARLDSVNREGIYRWNNMILVIGSVNFSSKSEMVRRGEAIIDADKTILNYIRINKVANIKNRKTQTGKTYMVPFVIGKKKEYFQYNFKNSKWQYMICYTEVINEKTTAEMSKFLPPLQFIEEISK